MANNNCSCWKIVECETPEDCPDKCETGKTCWEISFLHNSWEKVFEKCKHCKVFQSAMLKEDEIKQARMREEGQW